MRKLVTSAKPKVGNENNALNDQKIHNYDSCLLMSVRLWNFKDGGS